MDILPPELLDLSQVDTVTVSGRGGKERDIAPLLPGWQRSSSALYDYEINYSQRLWRIEVKKQANEQWFDSGKYYQLKENDRDIFMLFINHIQGRIFVIAAMQLGSFIDLLMSTPENRVNGWTEEVLAIGAHLKNDYPALQFKAKARIGYLLRNYSQYFQILFSRL